MKMVILKVARTTPADALSEWPNQTSPQTAQCVHTAGIAHFIISKSFILIGSLRGRGKEKTLDQ